MEPVIGKYYLFSKIDGTTLQNAVLRITRYASSNYDVYGETKNGNEYGGWVNNIIREVSGFGVDNNILQCNCGMFSEVPSHMHSKSCILFQYWTR